MPCARRREEEAGSARSASQDALDEAQLANDGDLEKSSAASPPPPSCVSERAKKVAEVQKARNEEKVVADLIARLVAELATLRPSWKRQRRGKSQSVLKQESQAAAAETVQREYSKEADGDVTLFDISLQSFRWLPFS
jgi:hypothetical protein